MNRLECDALMAAITAAKVNNIPMQIDQGMALGSAVHKLMAVMQGRATIEWKPVQASEAAKPQAPQEKGSASECDPPAED